MQHDNPKIQVVLNDGTQVYEHHSDGQKQEKANCLREFRNRPYPVKLRITYLRGVLEVRGIIILYRSYAVAYQGAKKYGN